MLISSVATTLMPIMCEPPPSLVPWLIHKQSLTNRLVTKAQDVALTVLRQCWDSPDWWDKHVLQIKDDNVLHREIVMQAAGESCWYARTIIPKTTFDTNIEFFNRLKKESLGVLIFNEKKLKRDFLFHYPINYQTLEYHWLDESMHCQTDILWSRMSMFTIGVEFPLFLIEIMLPGLKRYSN